MSEPVAYAWTVDTTAPGILLLESASQSGSVTQGPIVLPYESSNSSYLQAACTGESAPEACTFCVSVSRRRPGSTDVGAPVCTSGLACGPWVPLTAQPRACRVPFGVPPQDDTYLLQVWAVDGAGNAGSPTTLTVIRDTVPPVLTVTLPDAVDGALWNNGL